MNAQQVNARLRAFLFITAALLCVGTVIELSLTEHTDEPIQFVPFILSVLAFVCIVFVMLKPTRGTLFTLRGVMGALVLGSLVGVYEHLASNWEIVTETKPNLAANAMFWEAVRGAAPMLAPGILVLVAALAIAATYEHPALNQPSNI